MSLKRSHRVDVESTIFRIAASQHGVVARKQLLEAGVSGDAVDRRVKRGWIRNIHRGVYAVGPVSAALECEAAALLACGPGAILSHRSAASLWQILPPVPDAPVTVTVAGGKHPQPAGVRVHRARNIPSADVTTLEGMRVTTLARTLCDLADGDGPDVEQALAVALQQETTDRAELESLLRRCHHRRGVRRLCALLSRDTEPALTRSDAETRFLALVRKAQLGAPRANTRVDGREVDFLWRTERLIVEIDGYAFHRGRGRFEMDRSRDARLVAAGYRVMRFTWIQLDREPETILVRLAQALVRASPS